MPSPSTDTLSEAEEAAKLTVAEKWQGAVKEGAGFVAVPMVLLRLQAKYELSATDMLVLINLLAHWWDPARSVFPRTTTIAQRMGIEPRTVQRSTKKLLTKGLMTRETLPNGKRAFNFERLAKRLAKDVPTAFAIQGREALWG